MDETPGHADEEPEKVTPGGALPPPAGDPGLVHGGLPPELWPLPDETQVLHPATEGFIDEMIEHLAGGNPMETIVDNEGHVVGIRIMPGRPDDYDTYLDRPHSQRNLTYDDWAELRRIQTGDPHADQAPRLDTSSSERRLRVRRVTVVLDPGDQTTRAHTVDAWAVVDQHDPHWPTHEDTLIWIGFDRESAEHALTGQ